MTQWIRQYHIFRKNDCNQMIADNRETRASITDSSLSVKKLQFELDHIEKIWSAQAHRQSAALQLTPSRNVGAIVTGRRETPEEKWHNEVSYDFVNNQYKLTWHVNANMPCDFDILIAMRHEAEHANQSIGFGYTQDEQMLIWIERACHSGSSENYWSQFSEMNARMREAEFCIELLTTHKAHLSVYDQLSIMHLAESVLHRLSYQTTNESIVALQQSQKGYLEGKRFPAQYLSKAVPPTFFWQRNSAALSFLENTAPSLYENCYQKLQDVHRQLSQYVSQWQQSIPNAVQRYEHNQENERLQELAQQYSIPVLTELPDGVRTLPIHGDSHAERYIQDSAKRGYSPALIITNQPAQLVYDTKPVPRSYSTSPALRMQWQSENEAPNDASVGAPEYDSHDEMDDL